MPSTEGSTTSGPWRDRADHPCCVYHDDRELLSRSARFLAGGRRAGMRLACVGVGLPAASMERLSRHGSEASEQVQAIRPDDLYGRGPVDAAATLDFLDRMTTRALEDGFTGLRLVSDASDRIRTAEDLDAFARYEIELGRFVGSHHLSAMCAFSADLGAAATVQLACVHPAGPGAAPFRMELGDDGVIRLMGEVDVAARDAFEATLRRMVPYPDGGRPVVDLSAASFVDHRALDALEVVAEALDCDVRLVGAAPLVGQMVSLLSFSRLQVGRAG